jgi:hypothetical protein
VPVIQCFWILKSYTHALQAEASEHVLFRQHQLQPVAGILASVVDLPL